MIERVRQACAFIRGRIAEVPEFAVILGSGLGAFADSLEESVVIPYEQVPNWPVSTAPGHSGRLVEIGRAHV